MVVSFFLLRLLKCSLETVVKDKSEFKELKIRAVACHRLVEFLRIIVIHS